MNDRLSARHAVQNQDTFDAKVASISNDSDSVKSRFAKTLEIQNRLWFFDDCHYLRIRPTYA